MSKKPILLQSAFRSGLEEKVAAQLDAASISYTFEGEKIPYDVPARSAKYIPDFPRLNGTNIVIEAKGRFGHHRSDGVGAKERQKLCLVKEQHPELDIRIIFQDARKPIYKGSKTTYAKWAEDHGFKWSDKGTVPADWIRELKQLKKKGGRG